MDDIPGGDLGYVKLTVEFAKLKQIIGRHIRDTDSWAPWQRLRNRFGWGVLLKAADRCDPDGRWPNKVEGMCLALEKEEKDARKEQVYAETKRIEAVKTKARLVKVDGVWTAVEQ